MFFEGTIAAIETGVEMDVGREAGFGFSGIVVVERQPATSGADEAIATKKQLSFFLFDRAVVGFSEVR